jgi:uncharacterized membrane protein (DUF373 family)
LEAVRGQLQLIVEMRMKRAFAEARESWRPMTFYQRFEHVIILILTGLIAIVVVAAVWNLLLNVLLGLVRAGSFDIRGHSEFQAVFGMIFTVIIALEFKKSLLVMADRVLSVVQVRAVLVIALLAIVRKLIILDLSTTTAQQLFALSAAILALGAVYWLTRDQDRRDRHTRSDA